MTCSREVVGRHIRSCVEICHKQSIMKTFSFFFFLNIQQVSLAAQRRKTFGTIISQKHFERKLPIYGLALLYN